MKKELQKVHHLRFAAKNKETWSLIKSGKKKIETRAGTVKYQKVKAGDSVLLSCGTGSFKKKIVKVSHFKTFASLFKKYPPNTIHPGIGSAQNMIAQYHSFPNYEEKIKKSGILAFELE